MSGREEGACETLSCKEKRGPSGTEDVGLVLVFSGEGAWSMSPGRL